MSVIGEVIYFYLYDLGGSLEMHKVRKSFKGTTGDLRRERKIPSYLSIRPEPLSIELQKTEIIVHGVSRKMRIEARVHSVGAVSIIFRIQFQGELRDLINYSSADSLGAIQGSEKLDFKKLSQNLADEVSQRLAGSIAERYEKEQTPEEYSIFCISNLQRGKDATKFLNRNRKVITGILREIHDVERVSDSECESALRYMVTYSSDYLAVVDWSSSLVAQTSNDYEDYILTIELANLQLLQLRTFDRLIDRLIDKAYTDTKYISNPPWTLTFFTRGFSGTVTDIAEMRMEMTDVFDKVMNISKFFGDYTVARLYEYLSTRLHLQKWQETVSRKLDFLEDLYQMASDKVASRQMLLLEALIVLLFVFEVVLAVTGFFK